MGTLLALVELFNAVSPGVASLVTMIRHKDGTLTVLQVLDENDAAFDSNLKQAAEWFAKKKK